jgi:Mn-dependent DtxR family transcriptional regulator
MTRRVAEGAETMKTFTIDELAQALSMSLERVEQAINDLMQAEMIELVSEGRWRPTEAGRAIVHRRDFEFVISQN